MNKIDISKYTSGSELITLLLAFCYPFIFLLANAWGVTTSSDAGTYTACAESMLTACECVGKDGQPYYLYPPLYPFFIAISLFLSDMPVKYAALYVQVLMLFVTAWLLLRLYFPRAVWFQKAIVLVLTIAAATLFKVYMYAFSEVTYIAFSLLLIAIYREFRKKQNTQFFIWLIICTSLLPMIRYIGLTFVISLTLIFMLKKEYKRGFILCTFSLLPVGLWFLRNYLHYGVVSGGHTRFAFHTLDIEVLIKSLSILGHWLNPIEVFYQAYYFRVLIGLLYVILFVYWIFRDAKFYQNYHFEIWYILVYLASLFVIIRLAHYNYNFERLLFPLHHFVLIFYLKLLWSAYRKINKYLFFKLLGVAIFLFWLLVRLRESLMYLYVRRFGLLDFSIKETIAEWWSLWI
ncbi:MAG: hypothetical protein JJT94_08730 [Bernardetiaceae bacterium]|nr:hypothetical protein [Bernardetiaceae bacterium]